MGHGIPYRYLLYSVFQNSTLKFTKKKLICSASLIFCWQHQKVLCQRHQYQESISRVFNRGRQVSEGEGEQDVVRRQVSEHRCASGGSFDTCIGECISVLRGGNAAIAIRKGSRSDEGCNLKASRGEGDGTLAKLKLPDASLWLRRCYGGLFDQYLHLCLPTYGKSDYR